MRCFLAHPEKVPGYAFRGAQFAKPFAVTISRRNAVTNSTIFTQLSALTSRTNCPCYPRHPRSDAHATHESISRLPPSTMATKIAATLRDKPLSRLERFFHKYPPSQYSARATGQSIPTSRQMIAMDAKPLSATTLPQADSIPAPVVEKMSLDSTPDSGFSEMINPVPSLDESSTFTSTSDLRMFPPNPFLPYRNPETGRWRGARIGLRQQADLYKLARAQGVDETDLPASIKSMAYKHARALERGLAVKGTGEGQFVKGHKWERRKATTLAKRVKAMESMPGLIREWEQRGHGRGWKKYPREKVT